MGSDLKTRAARATWWSGLEISARYGTQFIVTVVLARMLPPEAFGLIAMLLVFTSIAALLIDAGLGISLVQQRDVTPDDETTVFLFSTGAGLVLAGASWLCGPLLARFFNEQQLAAMLPVLGVMLLSNALATVPDAMLSKRLDFRARTLAEVVGSIVSGAIAIVLALRGFGAWTLVVQAVSGSLLRTSMLWIASGWRPQGRFSRASLRALSSFGGYMLLTNLLDTLSIRLQAVLIGRLFNPVVLGYYTIAQNTQQAPASFVGSILSRVGLPVFSTVSHDSEALRESLRISLRTSMFLFLPCMVGMGLIAEPLVTMLYGARWLPSAKILSVLALASAFWPLHVLNLAAISAQGRSDLFFKLAVAKKMISIALILLVSPMGPQAIAWSILASSVAAIGINTHYTARLLDYGVAEQLQDQANTIVSALIAAIAGWCVLHWNAPGIWATATSIVLAVLVYVTLAFATRARALGELLGIASTLVTSARPAEQAQTAELP